MRSSHGLDRLDVAPDGTHQVADAGLRLPATLAQHLAIQEPVTGVASHDRLRRDRGPRSPGCES